jgi:DNA damage-binding protein 1
MRLQVKMGTIILTLGNIDFNHYRSFKIDTVEHEEPFRFVDGELIERFLDVDEEVQEEIVSISRCPMIHQLLQKSFRLRIN